MTAHPEAFEDAKCIGKWFLFESPDMNDHIEARELCDECPAKIACRQLLKEVLADTAGQIRNGGGPTGTWAGRLYGSQGLVAACGTESGYDRHRRARQEACQPCLAAKNAACTKRYHRKKRGAA